MTGMFPVIKEVRTQSDIWEENHMCFIWVWNINIKKSSKLFSNPTWIFHLCADSVFQSHKSSCLLACERKGKCSRARRRGHNNIMKFMSNTKAPISPLNGFVSGTSPNWSAITVKPCPPLPPPSCQPWVGQIWERPVLSQRVVFTLQISRERG